jgi:hypothetical protein
MREEIHAVFMPRQSGVNPRRLHLHGDEKPRGKNKIHGADFVPPSFGGRLRLKRAQAGLCKKDHNAIVRMSCSCVAPDSPFLRF